MNLGRLGRLDIGLDFRVEALDEFTGESGPFFRWNLKRRIEGCVFAGRCPRLTDVCRKAAPALQEKATGHRVACHHAVRG